MPAVGWQITLGFFPAHRKGRTMPMLKRHTTNRRLHYAAFLVVASIVLTLGAVDSIYTTIGYGDSAMLSDWYAPAAWALFALGCQTGAAAFVAAHFDRRYQ